MEIERPDWTQYIMKWQEILDDCISEYGGGGGGYSCGQAQCTVICYAPIPSPPPMTGSALGTGKMSYLFLHNSTGAVNTLQTEGIELKIKSLVDR